MPQNTISQRRLLHVEAAICSRPHMKLWRQAGLLAFAVLQARMQQTMHTVHILYATAKMVYCGAFDCNNRKWKIKQGEVFRRFS